MQRTILAFVIVSLAVNSTPAQSITTERPSIRVRLTGFSGERVTGRARALENGVLEFARDGEDGRITSVQLDSIRLIERGSRRAARPLATAAGAGVSFLGSVVSIFGGLAWCNDESIEGRCWGLFEAVMYVGAPVAGGLFGWYLGRMKWKTMTVDELQDALTPATLP